MNEVDDLRAFFRAAKFPSTPIRLTRYSIISDCQAFVEACFRSIDSGQPTPSKQAIDALHRLRHLLTAQP